MATILMLTGNPFSCSNNMSMKFLHVLDINFYIPKFWHYKSMTRTKLMTLSAVPSKNNASFVCMCGSRGGDRGLDPLKNRKATKPAFNVGPSLARQGNAI